MNDLPIVVVVAGALLVVGLYVTAVLGLCRAAGRPTPRPPAKPKTVEEAAREVGESVRKLGATYIDTMLPAAQRAGEAMRRFGATFQSANDWGFDLDPSWPPRPRSKCHARSSLGFYCERPHGHRGLHAGSPTPEPGMAPSITVTWGDEA